MEQYNEPAQSAPLATRYDSQSCQEDRELMEAWRSAKERTSAVEVPDMPKADFSALSGLLGAKGITAPDFDPFNLEQMKADMFNAESQPPDATGWDCPICRNKETIYVPVRLPDGSASRRFRPCKCVSTKRTIRRMQQSGLESIISDNLFQKFEAVEPWQQSMKDTAISFAKELSGWLFIGGQSGCGKTHLCTAICREALLRGKQVIYMMWRDDAPRLKASVNKDEYPELVDQFKKAEVLYIDDLFKTGRDGADRVMPTAADINLAYEIINFRYVGKLPTIISSEFMLKEMIDIDQALAGRIAERSRNNNFNINPDLIKNYRLRGIVEL